MDKKRYSHLKVEINVGWILLRHKIILILKKSCSVLDFMNDQIQIW